ncbi:MAG: DUF1648 domain-containing protein [Victivallaceae bacterium]
MRVLFFMVFAANVVLGVTSLFLLPARVAIHFGAGGVANGWGSNYANCIMMTGVQIFMFLVIYYSSHLIFLLPAWLVNLPNKEYWLRPEAKTRTLTKLRKMMCSFGVGLFLFLFIVGLLTLDANLSKPVKLNMKVFFSVMSVFLIYTAGWCVVYLRAFRIPAEEQQ